MTDNIFQKLIEIRRKLHQIPEIGFNEFETSKYIIDYCKKLENLTIEKVAKTGVLVFKKGSSSKVLAFRADIDALEIQEETGLKYASKNTGFMHACGHDFHTTLLLGIAEYISRYSFEKSILLIFQPAEEGPGGAKEILKDEKFLKYDIEKIFALHITNDFPVGSVGIKSDIFTAYSYEFFIKLQGEKTHAALPHQGNDMILAVSELVIALQHIVSRKIDPTQPALLSIGKIQAGERINVIASEANIEGTFRTFHKKTLLRLQQEIKKVTKGISLMNSCLINLTWGSDYPPIINDRNLFFEFMDILKNNAKIKLNSIKKPFLFGEDFGYFSKKYPTFMFYLGAANLDEKEIYNLHTSKFNPDEKALNCGFNIWKSCCDQLGIKKK